MRFKDLNLTGIKRSVVGTGGGCDAIWIDVPRAPKGRHLLITGNEDDNGCNVPKPNETVITIGVYRDESSEVWDFIGEVEVADARAFIDDEFAKFR